VSQATMLKTINNRIHDFSILKSDELYIGGYASIEVVDKQNDLITLDALGEAVKKYMNDPKYRNVMTNHSNVQVGEVVKEYRDKSGKLWKTDVDDVGFFVVIKLRDDIEKAKEVGREIRKGTMRSFSIGGQALEKRKRNNDELGDYNEISKLELHEVTICEKGINPEAKFDILKQDEGETMTNISEAINELNSILKNIEQNDISKYHDRPNPSPRNPREEEPSIDEMVDDEREQDVLEDAAMDRAFEEGEDAGGDLEDMDLTQKGEKMTNVTKEEEMDKKDMELAEGDDEMDLENTYKATNSATGTITGEAGKALEEDDNLNEQSADMKVQDTSGALDLGSGKLRVSKRVWGNDTPTLDLSVENVEKAYAEFKAEQMEKLAYEDVKRSFQSRFDAEVSAKTDAIAKASYDPRAEVNELRKQFSDLLDTLKNDAEMTIKKHDDAVAAMNIPTYEEIAKMDWADIHLTIQRLEDNL
tara:strand:+ start:1608 stop:3029 length:1422 start_codon:yes stop_codon:yes gene_type:complete